VLGYFDRHAKVLGVTATPDRGDKKNLGRYFERVAFECSLVRLIKDGFLVPIKVKMLPVRMDLTRAKTVAGDYSADDVAAEIEPWLERVAAAMAGEAWDRKTIVFLPLVKTSERMAEVLRAAGFDARSVSGYDTERDETLRWFATAGPGAVLCNAMLLTEGFDQPDVDCIVILRPTQVRALYAQMVGRGTRLSPDTGKRDLLLLDFLWQSGKVSLVSAGSLITGNAEDVKAVQDLLIDVPPCGPGAEHDLVQVCDTVEEQRFRKVKEKLKENRGRKAGTHDALELCMSIGAVELMDYEPCNPREAKPPTAGQVAALEGAGFDLAGVSCFGHASAILDRLAVRRMEGLATPKQVRLLQRFRHPKPESATFEEAGKFIGRELGGRRK
jgi:superfamily II DNA or RNA helicase